MVDCLRQLNAGGIMRSCDPLRDFQKNVSSFIDNIITFFVHIYKNQKK